MVGRWQRWWRLPPFLEAVATGTQYLLNASCEGCAPRSPQIICVIFFNV